MLQIWYPENPEYPGSAAKLFSEWLVIFHSPQQEILLRETVSVTFPKVRRGNLSPSIFCYPHANTSLTNWLRLQLPSNAFPVLL